MEREWSFYRGSHLNGGEWSCYGGGQFKGGENGHVTEVVTLIEGEKSCQSVRGGQFNGERMVLLQKWSV